MELHITRKDETICVALLGEFEAAGIEELQARLATVRDDREQPVIDLGRVVVIDSASSEHGFKRKDPAPGQLDTSA